MTRTRLISCRHPRPWFGPSRSARTGTSSLSARNSGRTARCSSPTGNRYRRTWSTGHADPPGPASRPGNGVEELRARASTSLLGPIASDPSGAKAGISFTRTCALAPHPHHVPAGQTGGRSNLHDRQGVIPRLGFIFACRVFQTELSSQARFPLLRLVIRVFEVVGPIGRREPEAGATQPAADRDLG